MSSAIRHLHYRPETGELSIWFGPEGRRYTYFDVPPATYEALRAAPSRGQYFNQSIKGHYRCAPVGKPDRRNRGWVLRSAP
ncbi:KTSC domain-containing protein [Devosia sp. PTR5]|jgi:hypothetical protein|uniref:KTSC domain-containing protein n=1 Tax=Devosia oryzisoli TaxID=2774138 RepID=A0A927FSC0_9HYPH|nr:KTSC domain-containing protein [Devosia oryzisoli]MBD8065345.1 KTSC domain-containing protein [Devosia oryzisoli]